MNISITTATERHGWLKRVGQLGFWFFLIKGLFWLIAPLTIYFLR